MDKTQHQAININSRVDAITSHWHPELLLTLNGDVFRVPQGVQHRPLADVEAGIMIIEKVGTTNTGEREGHERTVYVDENR